MQPKDHLQVINGIKFSPREIDIIAYIVGGRSTKKIAKLSGLSPRTVENYTRNIMIKLECNSRESIIDFIEKSEKLSEIRGHYSALIGHKSHSAEATPETSSTSEEDLQDPKVIQFWKRKRVFVLGAAFLIFVGFISLSFINNGFDETIGYLGLSKKSTPIRSALILPSTSTNLIRQDVLSALREGFNGYDGIQTIALVGIGGAGKTTLARQYANQQNLPAVWEFNAATPENLHRSFVDLAGLLAKTDEDKKILNGLMEIKDSRDKDGKVIQFVKERLITHSGWLLIFDNVEKFSDIQNYYPNDPKIWGEGHIILTTTDSNIQTNPHVNKTIFIDKLTPEESLKLFESIMTQGKGARFSKSQQEEAKKFLENIPAFPLDISVAAYYIKATHNDYNQYLNNLMKYDEKFAHFQEKILKEASEYTKTRQRIINLSIQHLIKENPEFVDLLLFVCLLDSHNIPRDLLGQYKNNLLVDDFIYNLKKFSLIQEIQDHTLNSSSFVSIHRRVQDMCIGYLSFTLTEEKKLPILTEIGRAIQNYVKHTLEKEDVGRIKLLAVHLSRVLNHGFMLPEKIKALLGIELGRTHMYLGNSLLAKQTLENSITLLNNLLNKEELSLLQAQSYLGAVCRELGDYEKARDLLDFSLRKYQQHNSNNYKEIAWTSGQLGNVYRSLGDYGKAKAYLSQSLEIYKHKLPQNYLDRAWTAIRLAYVYNHLGEAETAKKFFEEGLSLYKTSLPKDHIKIAWVQVHLANIHNDLGKYDLARSYLENSISIFKKHFPKEHHDILWATVHLADVYRSLKDFEKAQNLLNESYSNYLKFFEPEHTKMAWVYKYFGLLYRDRGEYEKAQTWLGKCLAIYEKKYGKNHLRTANILNYLGQAYLLSKNFAAAESHFNRALAVYVQHQHPDQYKPLIGLEEVYTERFRLAEEKGDFQQAGLFKEQALQNLKEAQKIVTTHYSKDSPQWKSLDSKKADVNE